MTKVSVIIPVYRSDNYLSDCLNSVLNQNLQDFDIICINDASDDRCAVILDEYAKKDRRIRIIHLPENKGTGYVRNLGLKTARGKYVYFLDSDDTITESALSELYDRAEKEQLEGIFFDSRTMAENEDQAKKNRFYQPKRIGEYPAEAVSGRELFSCFIRNNEWEVYVQRQFWRRDFLISSGVCFIEGIIHDDEFFSAAAVLKAGRVRYIPEQYVIHRFRAGSITDTKQPDRDVAGYFTDYCEMTAMLEEMPHLREAVFNAAHLRELTVRYFQKLSKEEQRKNLFAGQPLEKEYAFFMHEMEVLQAEKEVFGELFYPLHDYASVVVYGAGVIAGLFTRRLLASGKSVDRYVVSSGQSHPVSLNERPVICFDELDLKDNEVLVAAMASGTAAEVSKLLSHNKIEHFIYDGRRLCRVKISPQ